VSKTSYLSFVLAEQKSHLTPDIIELNELAIVTSALNWMGDGFAGVQFTVEGG
jgi:hypothetical protein